MNVTLHDKKNEQIVLASAGLKIGILNGFQPTQDETAIWDFEGKNAFCDVKVRDIASNAFYTVPLSKEKGDEVLKCGGQIQFYMVYYYALDQVVRVYLLNTCTLNLYENYSFVHKRTGKRITQPIYMINKADSLVEFSALEVGLSNRVLYR